MSGAHLIMINEDIITITITAIRTAIAMLAMISMEKKLSVVSRELLSSSEICKSSRNAIFAACDML